MSQSTPSNLSKIASRYKPPTPTILFNFSSQPCQEKLPETQPTFTGASYDFGKPTWQSGNVIENDATIQSPGEDVEDLAPEGLSQDEAIKLVAERGLASGRLWIQQEDSSLSAFSNQSGFFISDRYFLSVFHFNRNADFLDTVKNPGSRLAVITLGRKCKAPFDRTTRWVHLVGLDTGADITLWKLDDGEECPRYSIPWEDFMVFEGEKSIPQFAGKTIWSVGYAALLEEEVEFADYVNKYLTMMDKEHRAAVEDNKIPNYENVFAPHERCLFLGKISKNLEKNSLNDLPAEISAWKGLSGSMIGMFVRNPDNSSNWSVKIVGLIKGGEPDQWANSITAFTPGIMNTITEWMARE